MSDLERVRQIIRDEVEAAERQMLVDFLRARIAEDGFRATGADGDRIRVAVKLGRHTPMADLLHVSAFDPQRILAECEAKRRIVEQFEAWCKTGSIQGVHALESATRILASVYADHPDYREEWRV